MPRTGRPKKAVGRKDHSLQLRLTKETMDKINECAAKKETTRTAIVEEGIDLVHKSLNEK